MTLQPTALHRNNKNTQFIDIQMKTENKKPEQ